MEEHLEQLDLDILLDLEHTDSLDPQGMGLNFGGMDSDFGGRDLVGRGFVVADLDMGKKMEGRDWHLELVGRG